MDIHVSNRENHPKRATRKPLQDTTFITNNYSSPTPARQHSKPHSSDHAKGMGPHCRYIHTQENTDSNNPQLEGTSTGTGRPNPKNHTASTTNLVGIAPRVRTGKARVGPWILGRTLGKGSSGRVRLAKHIETGQLAAIKIVGKGQQENSPHGEYNQGEICDPLPSGLEREVVIMKLISHPNVMGLLDVWENRGELYLILEYIEGGELFDHLTSRGRLPEKEAMRYFRQIMSGIDYCQCFNICHRDLKPENLLLDADDNIKIADFGMAALQPQGSLLDTPCGSPHYASPEIVSGKEYDGARSDIWSCGIVLFALLAGYLPFDHQNIRELLRGVMRGRFDMPQEFSNEAQDLIWRMLTVDPKARITMEQIWKHPLVKRHAPIDAQTGLETDRGPNPPTSMEIGRPVNNKVEIDREIMRNLQTLWQGVREKELVERLLSNVYNQEKVFYHLLMKYRREHLENYSGKKPAPDISRFNLKSRASIQVSNELGASYNNQQSANGPTQQNNQNSYQEGPLTSQDDNPRRRTRGGEHVDGGRRSCAHNQTSRSGVSHGRQNHEDLQGRKPKPHLKAVASRPSLAAPTRCYESNVNGRRHLCSKSSLISYMSNSPSAYKSIKPSRSYKRHVSFRRHTSRNASARPPLAVRNNTDRKILVENQNHGILGREDSPRFEMPEAAILPRNRKKPGSIAKRPTVIDDHASDSSYGSHVQFLRKKKSFVGENEDADRRRMVSRELEEACERAFNSSDIRSSFTALNTVKRVNCTSKESVNSTGNPNGSGIRTITPSLDHDRLTTENSLPCTPIRKASGGNDNLRIIPDAAAGFDKGCLEDVIEHLDRLMNSSAKLHKIGQPRAVSQGGAPLSLGDPFGPSHMSGSRKQYLDQEKVDRGSHLLVRANGRNVSAPNPHISSILDQHGHRSKQLIPTHAGFEPKQLQPLLNGTLRESVDETPRSETENNICAVNEALQFDSPMPTPQLRLPVAQEVQHDISRPFGAVDYNSECLNIIDSLPVDDVGGPKKKRSFLDIITGKKATKVDKTRGMPSEEKGLKAQGIAGTPDALPIDVLNIEEGTFGRCSGAVLRRFISRGTKKEMEAASDFKKDQDLPNESNMALSSMLEGGNSLVSCPPHGGYKGEGEDNTIVENHDEFARVMGQRNWFQRVLNVKPASRVIHFNVPALQCRKEVLKLYKGWMKHGLVIVEDDRRGLVLRARVGNSNTLNIREVTFVSEIRIYSGNKRTGTSVVHFTQEKGAASSFNRVIDEIAHNFDLQGLLPQNQKI